MKISSVHLLECKVLGALIKVNRLAQNRSQATLCLGICVPSYLSKIENGEITSSAKIVLELFEAIDIEFYDDEDFIKESDSLTH